MPDSVQRYGFYAVYYPDNPDVAQPLAVEGKIIVFDSVLTAGWFVQALAGERAVHENADGETFYFTPLVLDGFNKVVLATGYDPYDVPAGYRAMGIWSEAKGRDWRYHILVTNVLVEMKAHGLRNAKSLYPEIQELLRV